MLRFAQTCDSIGATTKKLEKTALVAAYLQKLLQTAPPSEAEAAVIFLSGRPFPAFEEKTLQVGGALLWRVIGELSGKSETELTEIYRRYGDAGDVAGEALPAKPAAGVSATGMTLTEVQRAFSAIAAARGPTAKAVRLHELLGRAMPLEAKYIVKIISGDLRIGLKESLVEEAIARVFEAPIYDVKRANMLLGNLGGTLRLASVGKLAEARLRLFHPIGFMLASPVESSEEALSYFENASVEEKYDGIRAQVHIGGEEVRIFSRTRDEITESFPELPAALLGIRKDAILDGEIVAWSHGAGALARKAECSSAPARAMPFSALQQRLGRKNVSAQLMREIPVAYLVFDVLYADGEILLDRPLRERSGILDELMGNLDTEAPARAAADTVDPGRRAERSSAASDKTHQVVFSFAAEQLLQATIIRAPVSIAQSANEIESLFSAARDRGNEGLMIKNLDSPYTAGRRGKSWLKMKRELATLDVVVTAVEYGHGKRIGVLSDYTFAVWDGERLVNIGKAYSGLTDAEIAEMTQWFLAHKISGQGSRLEIEPKIVLEVAFNNMMRSSRHESGFALRFPRILRLRPDKRAEDADTIEAVQEIFERQHAS